MRAYIAVVVWLASGRIAQAEPQRSAAQNPAAQSPAAQSPAAQSLAVQSSAEVAFEKGRLLAESRLYERACAAFKVSQRLDPQFGTLFNLAGCYLNMGKIATAWQLYRELSRSDINLQRRVEAARLMTELAPRVPKVQVGVRIDQLSPALRVFVGDTEVSSLLDVEIPFDPGYYVISASCPGYLPFRQRIYVHPEEGASATVELDRVPEPIPEPVVPEPSSSKIGAKIVLAAGVGLLGFSAVAGWRWYVTDTGSGGGSTHWAMVTGSALVLGVGSTVIGGVKLAEPRRSKALHVAPAVGSGSASVFVGGAF